MNLRLSLTGLLMVVAMCQLKAQTRDTINVYFKDVGLESILDSISSQTGYFFSYNANIMPNGSLFTLDRREVYIDDLLTSLFVGTHLEFTKIEDQIILRKVIRDSDGNKRVYTNITGWVKEAQTGEPVFGAHVYINGSTVGTYTDSQGNYELSGLSPGNYQVVFSHIGYAPMAYEINSSQPSTYAINASLTVATNLLKGVEVSSLPLVSDDDWIHFYKKFSEEFIGESNNANKCAFINPEIIEFSYSDSLNTYEAVVKEPLVMENRGLGYRVLFEIDYFVSSPKSTQFHVRAAFEELEPDNRRTKKRWKKNRQRSYFGSTFHFLKSLIRNDLKSEGYEIFLIDDNRLKGVYKCVSGKDDLILTDNLGRSFLNFDGHLIVEYRKEYIHSSYDGSLAKRSENELIGFKLERTDQNINEYQSSSIELENKPVRLLKNGQLAEPEDVRFYGYWSWERMSELMPIDYDPKYDN